MPVLQVTDVMACVDWYTTRLGFDLAGTWADDEGAARFAIVRMDDVTLGLCRADTGGTGENWAAYVYLDDIAAWTDQALSRGARVVRGPEDSFYGCREVEVTDPSGNRVCFAQDLKPGPDGPGL